MKTKIAYIASVVKQFGQLVKQCQDKWMFMENSGENLCNLLYGSLDSLLPFYLAGTVLVWSIHFDLGI